MELTCMLDEDNLNPELATCLEKGNQYLNRYLTELRLRATPWHFDKCRYVYSIEFIAGISNYIYAKECDVIIHIPLFQRWVS